MTFQRAPPEMNGFGVITSTPGLTRSFQPLMCFGLPGRTERTTTESVTMPVVAVLVPVRRDDPGLDQALHVGIEREHRDIGLRPLQDGWLWVPDAP